CVALTAASRAALPLTLPISRATRSGQGFGGRGRMIRVFAAAACLSFCSSAVATSPPIVASPPKQRLLVLTDIEADPDDTQSLTRLLLYANEIDLEGLIATTSVHQKTRVAPESIRRVIANYAEVRGNLLLHDTAYPTGAS